MYNPENFGCQKVPKYVYKDQVLPIQIYTNDPNAETTTKVCAENSIEMEPVARKRVTNEKHPLKRKVYPTTETDMDDSLDLDFESKIPETIPSLSKT